MTDDNIDLVKRFCATWSAANSKDVTDPPELPYVWHR